MSLRSEPKSRPELLCASAGGVALLVALLILPCPAACGTESTPVATDVLTADLANADAQKRGRAREALMALSPDDLSRCAAGLLRAHHKQLVARADVEAILGLFGPDAQNAVSALAEAARSEENVDVKRDLLLRIGMLGVSARKVIPLLAKLKAQDSAPGVREAITVTIDRIDVTDAQVQDVLGALKVREYDSAHKLRSTYDAVKWVKKRWGLHVALIQEMMRLKLAAALDAKAIPFGDELDDFFMLNASAMRIGGPVLREAIEGNDDKLRDAALEMLASYGCSRSPSAWPAVHILVELLGSAKPEVRRLAVEKLGGMRRSLREDDPSAQAPSQALLPLQKMG